MGRYDQKNEHIDQTYIDSELGQVCVTDVLCLSLNNSKTVNRFDQYDHFSGHNNNNNNILRQIQKYRIKKLNY